jgi:hypothetical protein
VVFRPARLAAVIRPSCFVALAAAFAGCVHAAGGHHAVDDAALLDEGTCQVESWGTRFIRTQALVHAGLSCRIGAVEAGMAADHIRAGGTGTTTNAAQVKWVHGLGADWAAGVSVAPSWAVRGSRFEGTTLTAIATWSVRRDLSLHFNAGRDLPRQGPSQDRSGVAMDWTPAPAWTVTVERYSELQAQFERAGLRWAPTAAWNVDASRSARMGTRGSGSWTIGLTRVFDRP